MDVRDLKPEHFVNQDGSARVRMVTAVLLVEHSGFLSVLRSVLQSNPKDRNRGVRGTKLYQHIKSVYRALNRSGALTILHSRRQKSSARSAACSSST